MVPIVVPPEQLVGAFGCGPKTLNVIVPDGEEPPDNPAAIDDPRIALAAVPTDGADIERAGLAALEYSSALARDPFDPKPAATSTCPF